MALSLGNRRRSRSGPTFRVRLREEWAVATHHRAAWNVHRLRCREMPNLATRGTLRLRLAGPRDQARRAARFQFQGRRPHTRRTTGHRQSTVEVQTAGLLRITAVDLPAAQRHPPHLTMSADRTDARRLLTEAAHIAARRRLRPMV